MNNRLNRTRMRRARGFTLVEILTSLMVLAIGLTAALSMILGGVRFTQTAVDRNNAALIIPQAIEEIQRAHMINMPNTVEDGLLVETIYNSPNPDIFETALLPYIDPSLGQQNLFPPYVGGASLNINQIQPHTMVWPFPGIRNPYYMGGALRPRSAGSSSTDDVDTGNSYRCIYRLERHQEWHPHRENVATGEIFYEQEIHDSAFSGIYVLTLSVYRETQRVRYQNGSGNQGLVQVTEPMVVLLHDKAVR